MYSILRSEYTPSKTFFSWFWDIALSFFSYHISGLLFLRASAAFASSSVHPSISVQETQTLAFFSKKALGFLICIRGFNYRQPANETFS